MLLMRLPVRHRRLPVQTPNLCIHVGGSLLTVGLLKGERERNAVARFNGLLQVHHHDVVTTGLQFKVLSGFQGHTAFDLAHAHDALTHCHFVYLCDTCDGRCHCNQGSVSALYRQFQKAPVALCAATVARTQASATVTVCAVAAPLIKAALSKIVVSRIRCKKRVMVTMSGD